MSESAELVVNVSEAQFDAVVLSASSQKVVVVDFWAPWCGPCRTLGPILERVVAEHGGSMLLAKVNVDENPALAAKFGVQGIPAVKIFRGGKLVGQFTGALPEEAVREQLAAVAPTESDAWLAEAEELLANEQLDRAEALLRKVLHVERKQYLAMIRLAQIAMARGDNDGAGKLLAGVPEGTDEFELATGLLGRIDLLQHSDAAGGVDAARRRVEADGNDLESRYDLACCLTVEAKYEDALDHLLKVIAADRKFKDGAAKDAMVRIFGIIGPSSELANTYRSRLASLLY